MVLYSPVKGSMMSVSLGVIELDFNSSFTAALCVIRDNYLAFIRFCFLFEAGGSNFYLLGLS